MTNPLQPLPGMDNPQTAALFGQWARVFMAHLQSRGLLNLAIGDPLAETAKAVARGENVTIGDLRGQGGDPKGKLVEDTAPVPAFADSDTPQGRRENAALEFDVEHGHADAPAVQAGKSRAE